MREIRVLLVGETAVGKTALLTRLIDETFTENTSATIGVDFQIRHFETSSGRVKLQLWDTAGQERFRSITQSYFRGAEVIGLVYDVNEPRYEALEYWYKTIRDVRPDVPILLIGNKADYATDHAQSRVTAWATERSLGHEYCSAKSNLNISEVFTHLCAIAQPAPKIKHLSLHIEPTLPPPPSAACCSIL